MCCGVLCRGAQVMEESIHDMQEHTIHVVQQLHHDEVPLQGRSRDVSDGPAVQANIEHMHQQKVSCAA